jgi:hypothetical protein
MADPVGDAPFRNAFAPLNTSTRSIGGFEKADQLYTNKKRYHSHCREMNCETGIRGSDLLPVVQGALDVGFPRVYWPAR